MKRIEKIDFLRGIAVIFMVVYHLFSLIDGKINTIYTQHPYFIITGYISRIIFISLLGFSYGLSNKKFNKVFNKTLLLILLSLIMNIVTYIFYPQNYIRFGILHFLTTSLILLSLFSKINDMLPVISGIIMFIVYIFVVSKKTSSNILLNSLGFQPNYSTMDYFPIFKWFWVVGLGYISSNYLKVDNQNMNNVILKGISKIGKHSLWIYMLHFPIIFCIHKIFRVY